MWVFLSRLRRPWLLYMVITLRRPLPLMDTRGLGAIGIRLARVGIGTQATGRDRRMSGRTGIRRTTMAADTTQAIGAVK